MTKCVWRAPAQQRLLRFNCQTAVQKRPYHLRRRVRLRPLSLAKQSEGSGAPGGAACNIVRALLAKSAAPTGAPPETFASGLFAAFSFRRRAPLSHRGSREPRGQPAPGRGPFSIPGGSPDAARGSRPTKPRDAGAAPDPIDRRHRLTPLVEPGNRNKSI